MSEQRDFALAAPPHPLLLELEALFCISTTWAGEGISNNFVLLQDAPPAQFRSNMKAV